MFLADTLSRAHPPEVHACEFAKQLESIDHAESLTMPGEQLHRFKQFSHEDPVLKPLREMILRGWPNSKSGVPESIHAYYDIRDELTIQDDLIFKGQQVVVPSALRKEMMSCHAHRRRWMHQKSPRITILAQDVNRAQRVYLEMRHLHDSPCITQQGTASAA